MSKAAAKLIVIKPGALGDTLLLAPALRALREGLPGLEISVVGTMPAVRLIQTLDLADAVHDFNRLNFYAPAEAEYELLNGTRVLAHLALDAATCDALRTIAGVRSIASYPARGRQDGQHMAVYLHQCIRGCFPQTGELSRAPLACPLPDSACTAAPYAILAPGAGTPAKRAPLKVFEALARDMAARGVTPVFLSGEVEIEQGLAARFPDRYPRIDNPPLDELPGMLKAAVAVYANDSGPAHLAGLLGTPTTVFFGPTDPSVWGPWGPKVDIKRF